MNALIIGYGSIGKRHCKVLEQICSRIELVTSQNVANKKCYKNLREVNLGEFDYLVVATPTNTHFEILNFLDENVKGKIILCEKPIFDKIYDFSPKNNQIFIGYVLRYHPLLNRLKNMLKDEKIIYLNAICGQYLPTWRSGDYTKYYSANGKMGGGVLLDLSHEIDYATWLCGELTDIKSLNGKVSNLQISSDDLCLIIAKSEFGFVNISVDYLSHAVYRKLIIQTDTATYTLDFISNDLIKKDKLGNQKRHKARKFERNFIFLKMHQDILSKQKFACDFNKGLKVMEIIKKVQEQR